MKIKGDFVTNSSSTAYIIYLPDWFDIVSHIKEENPEYFMEEDESALRKVFDVLRSQSDSFLDYDMFDEDEEDIDASDIFNTAENMLRDMGLIVGGVDIGPDMLPTYVNIGSKHIKEKIGEIRSKIGDL